MKKNRLKNFTPVLISAAMLAAMLAGCGSNKGNQRESSSSSPEITINSGTQEDNRESAGGAMNEELNNETADKLEIQFGDDGASFVMQMEDNETAAAIARYAGTSDWRLPIYNYDGFDNWEVMQYYDIPSRYEIPSNPETVTSQQAGEVYYSEPNRIILFYQDGEVTGDYTKIGNIENTEEFREAVENNPVLEGWGNKIVRISSME